MLTVTDVTFSYRSTVVLQDLSFHLQPGLFSVALGPNGSGKTTLLRLVTGERTDYEGAIQLFGRECRTYSDEERARLARPDRDAMRSVVSALCEELVRVKERLDLFVRSDRLHVSELSSLMAPLRQIADTLAVLGFGQPRKVIIDQLAVVQGIAQGQREPRQGLRDRRRAREPGS